jgi:hypothetical protein
MAGRFQQKANTGRIASGPVLMLRSRLRQVGGMKAPLFGLIAFTTLAILVLLHILRVLRDQLARGQAGFIAATPVPRRLQSAVGKIRL